MKSQSLILILCLSYVYMDSQLDTPTLTFSSAMVSCVSGTNKLLITGTTNHEISGTQPTVLLSDGTSLNCELGSSSRLRNLNDDFNIICENIEDLINSNSDITISKITFREEILNEELNLSINKEQKCSSGGIGAEHLRRGDDTGGGDSAGGEGDDTGGGDSAGGEGDDTGGGDSAGGEGRGGDSAGGEEDGSEGGSAGGEAQELTPVNFGGLKVKAISVSQNNVVVAITLQDEDENKRLSDNASIKNLKLVDNGSFSQDLTCTINKGSKLSSVICTMQTAATDGSKYKLSGTDVEFESEGEDTFESVEIDNTEALAFTDDSESDTSSWLKNSIILFIFALLF